MRAIAIIILILVGTHVLRAAGSSDCGWYSYIGTNQYSFEVSWAVFDKTPIWRESDDQPPLPARKALRLARACLSKLFTDAGHWRLDAVSLSPMPEHDGHWIYLVRFYPPLPPNGMNGFVEPMTIPVLMSGVAVEPKISLWKR
jgi:hypothetical protein